MNITIRCEEEKDFSEVFALNHAAFGEDNEARLVDFLRISESYVPGLSLVATDHEKITGHILFTKIRINTPDGKSIESLSLAPMAVLPEFQHKGIGAALVKEGLQAAKAKGFTSVTVLGHANYYPKFGFEKAAKYSIFPPFDVPEDNFMIIELEPGALTGTSGTVEYPNEFATVNFEN